jgi:hypothetical protein
MPRPSAEVEAELVEARAAEAEAARVAEQRAREERAAADRLRRTAEPLVADLARALDRALAETADPPETFSRQARQIARAYRRGLLNEPGEIEPPESKLVRVDDGLALLYGLAESIAGHIANLTDPLADTFLAESEPVVGELDALECVAWRAFTARARLIATED